ncbi:MAG: hypothetical protein NT123_25585, partial [Proteobacteria bacterium]|nr:hypothetical protein [Pseudomonadota bacterium]
MSLALAFSQFNICQSAILESLKMPRLVRPNPSLKRSATSMEYLSLFRMPTPMKITGRSSSITNAFINSIIPVVLPSAQEVKRALEILGMTPESFQCAYCGSVASEWDHLRPLVKDKKPTGYISEIHNLV